MIPYGADRPTHLEKQAADRAAFEAAAAGKDSRLMPDHVEEGYPEEWEPSRCPAVTVPGYVLVQPDGRLHCNRCGHVADAPATPSSADGDTCGCWMHDCDECGRRLADGERPSRGAVRRHYLAHEAAMQRARERAVRDGFA